MSGVGHSANGRRVELWCVVYITVGACSFSTIVSRTCYRYMLISHPLQGSCSTGHSAEEPACTVPWALRVADSLSVVRGAHTAH